MRTAIDTDEVLDCQPGDILSYERVSQPSAQTAA
jgi:hypothetical protein